MAPVFMVVSPITKPAPNRKRTIQDAGYALRHLDGRRQHAQTDARPWRTPLQAEEFIRRFLLHVLPEGFERIRYYGFLPNRYREHKLAHCRDLLGMSSPEPAISKAGNDYRDRYEQLTGSSLSKSPVCHQGCMLMIEILPRSPHRCLTPIKVMMEKTALGSRSECAAQAWPNQATGDALPNASSRKESEPQISSFDDWNFDQLAPSLWQFSSTVRRLFYQPGYPNSLGLQDLKLPLDSLI
jgi:Putative transposase